MQSAIGRWTSARQRSLSQVADGSRPVCVTRVTPFTIHRNIVAGHGFSSSALLRVFHKAQLCRKNMVYEFMLPTAYGTILGFAQPFGITAVGNKKNVINFSPGFWHGQKKNHTHGASDSAVCEKSRKGRRVMHSPRGNPVQRRVILAWVRLL